MVTLSVAWVTIPSPNLQGGPCSHPPPPKATLECQGLGLGMFVGALFPSFLSGPVEKELEIGLGPRGQR